MQHSYVRLKRFNEFNVASWVWTSPPRKVSYLQMQRNAHAVACRDPQVSFLVSCGRLGSLVSLEELLYLI